MFCVPFTNTDFTYVINIRGYLNIDPDDPVLSHTLFSPFRILYQIHSRYSVISDQSRIYPFTKDLQTMTYKCKYSTHSSYSYYFRSF